MANAMRYGYLRGPGGRFRNPYDHGCKKNCSDFLINGYNEDVAYVEEPSVHTEGIGMTQMSRHSTLENGNVHSHQHNGNGHVGTKVGPSSSKSHQGHAHSSHCSHNPGKSKSENVPLGLGLGLGRTGTRSVVAS